MGTPSLGFEETKTEASQASPQTDSRTTSPDERDYQVSFLPIHDRVWKVLKSQLDLASAKNENVKLVGFAAAPALISFSKQELSIYKKELHLPYSIRLIEDFQKTATDISAGAVIRALFTKKGPLRRAQSSYRLLRKKPNQSYAYEGQKKVEPVKDVVDGELYVTVINYFLIKRHLIQELQEFEPIRGCHTCVVDEYDVVCKELLYVSDTATELHYKLTSSKNRDTKVVWKIATNMTFLEKKRLIDTTQPEMDRFGSPLGQPHYRIEYDLVPIVEKRNLSWRRDPPASASGEIDHDEEEEEDDAA